MDVALATLTGSHRLTTLAHRDHLFLSPLSGAKVDQVLSMLELQPGARVLDVGCGKGEMLVRLAERRGAGGAGVDPNADLLADARARATARVPAADLSFHAVPACDFDAAPESFDAALCVGSTEAYGTYRDTLRGLAAVVRPHGRMLVGERFWRRRPHPDYLTALGLGADELLDHPHNVRAGEEAGLVPICTATSACAPARSRTTRGRTPRTPRPRPSGSRPAAMPRPTSTGAATRSASACTCSRRNSPVFPGNSPVFQKE